MTATQGLASSTERVPSSAMDAPSTPLGLLTPVGSAGVRGMQTFVGSDGSKGARSETRRQTAIFRTLPVVVFGLFVGAWYFLSYWGLEHLFSKPRFLLPPPHQVLHESFTNTAVRTQLQAATLLSIRVALIGLSIAIVLGIALAVMMSQATWVERSLFPYLVALQSVPILAFVPLLGIFFGFNFKARVIVCVIISLFPIVSNTLFGLLSAEQGLHDIFTLHKASRWTRLVKLQFPAALPAMFAGLKIAAGLSVIGAVVGDTFFRQGKPGIGILIDNFRSRLQNEAMYGAVLIAAVLGIVVFVFFTWLSEKIVGHWYESTR
jgi:NitT/TauT family transport system permease protein